MFPEPPSGQGPVDSQGIFAPPPPPSGSPPHGGAPTGGPVPQGQGPGWLPPPAPPQGMYPSPMIFPSPPPRRGGRIGSISDVIIGVTLAMVLFGSLGLNLVLLVGAAGSSSTDQTTQVVHKGDRKQKIAVIPIEGMILDETVARFNQLIKRVEEDTSVQALVIEIDSPGGGVTASDEIHHRLTEFKQRRNIPVVVSMQSLATSGGYYIAVAGDYIFAQPSTMTGNIGVMMPRLNLAGLADKWGIEDNSLHATGADFKTAGSMWKEETPEERAYILGLIDEAFEQFKSVIVAGRADVDGGTRLTAPIEAIANGKVYMAREAKELGLIDAIGYSSDAYAHVQMNLGLSNPHVVRYQHKPTLIDLLGVSSTLGGGSAQDDGHGITVRLDRRAIEQLLMPRLMYLWRVQ